MPLRFGDFVLDAERRQLLRGGEAVPLEPRAWALLSLLLERRPKALSKEQIRDVLWPGTFVSESALARLVADLRSALGDDARQPRYVRTLHGFGYAFSGSVTVDGDGRGPSAAPGERSPYPGLAAFTEADAEQFFGREAEVTALLRKLEQRTLLAVIGPSGAGKTSLLRAGLVPALAEEWGVVVCQPGPRPFVSLALALAPGLAGDPEVTRDLARFDDVEVALSVLRRWRRQHGNALLVVDQFEELFTQNAAEAQVRFAELLGRAANETDVHVLLSMRDDFLMRCHEHAPLRPVFSELTPIGAPGKEELSQALVQPAQARGYQFEDEALVEEMVGVVGRERGALPLLAFAASRLWEERDQAEKVLTREAYQRIGGVAGALAQHAEATLNRVGPERERVVREMFRSLVTAEGTRAALAREELLSIFRPEAAREEAESVLDDLIEARLLTEYEAGKDPAAGGPTAGGRIEIVHESLLEAWPRLLRWQAQDQEGALLRDQLRQAARLWNERGRPDDLLWTRTSLREFQLWHERSPRGLTSTESAFGRAMLAHAARRRKRVRAVVAVSVAVLGLGLAVMGALWLRSEAAREHAEAESLRAEASKLVMLGEAKLAAYPTGALAYAIKSLELADTEAARMLALRALQQAPLARVARVGEGEAEGAWALGLAFSPDGAWVATGGYTKAEVLDRNGQRRLVLGPFRSGEDGMSVRFTPHSDALVGFLRGEVRVWSIPEGRELRRAQVGDGTSSLWLGDDGVVTATDTGGVQTFHEWTLDEDAPRLVGSMRSPAGFSVAKGLLGFYLGRTVYARSLSEWHAPPRVLGETPGDIVGIDVDRERGVVATSELSGEIRIWRADSGSRSPVRVIGGKTPAGVWIGPRGRWLLANTGRDGHPLIRIWDMEGLPGMEPVDLSRDDTVFLNSIALEDSAQWLASAHANDLALWWLGQPRPQVLSGLGAVMGLAFTPDGQSLVSASLDGTVRIWPLSTNSDIEPSVLLRAPLSFPSVAIDPKGRRAVVSGASGRIHLVPLDGGGATVLEGFSDRVDIAMGIAFGDEGQLVAAAPFIGPADEKVIRVWNLETGTTRVLGPLPGAGENFVGGIGAPGYLTFQGADRILACVRGQGIVSADLASAKVSLVAPWPRIGMYLNHAGRSGVGITTDVGASVEDASVWESIQFGLEDGEPTALRTHGPGSSAWMAAFGPSDSLLATGGDDGIVRVGPASGDEPHLLLGHQGPVRSLAFSPDGRWLASGGNDGTIRVWPVPDVSKPPLHTLPRDELLRKLRTHTNLRAVPDPDALAGYRLEPGPFPGWATPPEW